MKAIKTAEPLTPSLEQDIKSFERALLAANKSKQTIRTYTYSVRIFGHFLTDQGMPTKIAHIRREHVESFLVSILEQHSANTAATRYRGIQQFFKWLEEEGEVKASPLAKMKPPHIPESDTEILSDDQIRALLKSCDGNDFSNRRDTAIIRLFLDTGMRLSELTYLKIENINFDLNIAYVMGKGRRPRACPFGRKTAQALDRYMRIRAKHKYSESEALWLGREGPISTYVVQHMLGVRAKETGIIHVHPHMFRHKFAHSWLEAGGQEGDLRMIGGWNSPEVMRRYGKKLAADRAREAHKRLSPGDKI